MSRKHVTWLLAATLVVAAVLLFLPSRTGRESAFEVRPLAPGLSQRVNEVGLVKVFRAGREPVATLRRTDTGWVVEDAQSYPADWSRLKAMLAAIAQAQVIEPKTSKPEYYGRLGVEDITAADSTSVLVEIGEGDDMLSLLVGRTAQEREGQYVRFNGEDQALLIDRPIVVSGNSSDWLVRDIIDLADSEIVELTLTHPDGSTVSIRKASADDTDFVLQDLPEGRKIQSAWSVNSIAGSLAGLQLEDVMPDSGLDWSQATHLRALTADGVEVQADLLPVDEKYWLRLAASVYSPAAATSETSKTEGAVEATAGGEDSGEEVAETPDSALAERQQRVTEINGRVSGWAYSIPDYKAQLMSKHMDDLLAPVEQD